MTRNHTTLLALFGRWALAASLLLGAVGPVCVASNVAAQGVDIEESSVRFAQLAQRLETLRNRRRALQTQYTKLTDQIAARKRGGQNLLSDLELQRLLKRGRATADELYELQSEIRQVESDLTAARRGALSAFDERLAKLESSLVSGTGSNRAALIAEMNRLRQARFAYVAPTSATPDLALEDLPTLDSAERDPEEARAAAAELDDANRKLEEKIRGLDASIAEIEGQRRLRRKARSFKDQESFFDEAQKGGRRVAASSGGPRVAGATDGGGVGTAGDQAAEDGETALGGTDGPPAGAPEGDFDADNAADPGESPDRGDGMTPNDDFDGAGDGRSDGVQGAVDVLPGTGAPLDPFGGGGVIVTGEVETVVGAGSPDRDQSLDARLRRARLEREALEKKSQQLESRSVELRRLADEF